MADLIQSGAAWLAAQLKQHAGRTVIYRRRGESVAVTATVSSGEFIREDESGVVERIETIDFLIDAPDILLGGKTIEPKAGDVIEDTTGGVIYVYEVVAAPGEPAWRWTDTARIKRRVNAVLVNEK